MADFIPIGPAILLFGDPTLTGGAGMVNLGDTENVGFDAGIRSAFTSSARRVGVPHADSLYTMPPQPVVQAELKNAGLEILAAIVQGGVTATNAFGFGDTFALIAAADVNTFVIVPETQASDGVAANDAIWFPAALASGVNGISFGRVTEGEILQPYNIQIQAAYRTTDQASTAITAGNRICFKGPPADIGLTWYLPATL